MGEGVDPQIKIISMAKVLHGFGLLDLEELLGVSSKAVWKKGTDIFLEGDAGRDMYIICAGRVLIWRWNAGKKLELAELAAGESFGEMGLVNEGKRSAGAQAMEDTLALRIEYQLLSRAPNAAFLLYRNIAKALAERLSIVTDIVLFQAQHGSRVSPLEVTGKYRKLK
jgi:CRP-like cAMP-binding protein